MKRIAMQEAVKLSLRITSRGTSACGPGAALDRHEGGEHRHGQGEQADHPRVAPAPVVDLVEGDQQRDEADRERRDPGVVDRGARLLSGSLTWTRK